MVALFFCVRRAQVLVAQARPLLLWGDVGVRGARGVWRGACEGGEILWGREGGADVEFALRGWGRGLVGRAEAGQPYVLALEPAEVGGRAEW